MNLFENVDIVKGDKILVSSNLLKILVKNKNSDLSILPNKILDELILRITSKGTLFIPTYNWDFCKGKTFSYKKTLSLSGSLGNFALKRKDFLRTHNPIYSFAVTGYKREEITKLAHKSCFGLDSPFGYLIKNNGKNLFFDLDYKDAFTFCHVAEEAVGVNYRYFKKFEGFYENDIERKEKKEFEMYVRDQSTNIKMTAIHPDFDKVLFKNKALKKYLISDISIQIVDIKKAYELMKEELKKKNGLIYGKI